MGIASDVLSLNFATMTYFEDSWGTCEELEVLIQEPSDGMFFPNRRGPTLYDNARKEVEDGFEVAYLETGTPLYKGMEKFASVDDEVTIF